MYSAIAHYTVACSIYTPRFLYTVVELSVIDLVEHKPSMIYVNTDTFTLSSKSYLSVKSGHNRQVSVNFANFAHGAGFF
jgi:hypothetical protein